MHGGAMHDAVHRQRRRARTPASSTPTRRTARRTAGRTPTRRGFASVRSMWQRQIHFVLRAVDADGRGRSRSIAAGCGSWIDDVVPLALELQRVVEHTSRGRCAPSCGVHSTSAPCSALCTVLVTAKNSSLPWITCHSASMPRSRSSGDVGGEQLGDAAAVRGRVHVQHPRARAAARRASRIRSSVPGSTTSA